MSHIKALCSLQKRERTPTRLLMRSGPYKRCLFSVSALDSELACQNNSYLVWLLRVVHTMMRNIPDTTVC